jgi:hypothetical protein
MQERSRTSRCVRMAAVVVAALVFPAMVTGFALAATSMKPYDPRKKGSRALDFHRSSTSQTTATRRKVHSREDRRLLPSSGSGSWGERSWPPFAVSGLWAVRDRWSGWRGPSHPDLAVVIAVGV